MKSSSSSSPVERVASQDALEAAPTFVLVHGAWHGGWCYARVARALRAAGYEVFVPTLTGLGERSHLLDPSIDLSTHVRDIVNVLTWERLQRVVLVGHSYAGMVITGVAHEVPERLAALVYLDAFVPQADLSLHDLVGTEAANAQTDAASHGSGAIPPVPAALFNVNERDRAMVDALCTGQPLKTFTQALRLRNAPKPLLDRTFVLALNNHLAGGFGRFCEVARADGWRIRTVNGGHDLMLDAPIETAAILQEVAQSLSAAPRHMDA